jgi:hypothetical protein
MFGLEVTSSSDRNLVCNYGADTMALDVARFADLGVANVQ